MRLTATISLLAITILFSGQSFAQGSNDADLLILRVRAVCNGGQGSSLVVSYDIRARGGNGQRVIGGYGLVLTYDNTKLVLQSVQQRYQTAYWPGGALFRNHAFGPAAWYNQHSHATSQPGNALPLTSQYWTPAEDCSSNALNDGFFEVLRYTFNIGVSSNGTVDFGLFDVLPYHSGQAFQGGNTVTAVWYQGLQNNGNDSTLLLQNLLIPVELSAFTADSRADGSVQLSWRTETETSNLGFEIERGDGKDFSTIAFVEGQGTVTHATDYSYVDDTPGEGVRNGLVFYRLKQIDTDGSYEYSHIVSTALHPPTVGLGENYPNPFTAGGETVIPYNLAVAGTVDVSVYNSLGQKVAILAENLQRSAGRYEVSWDGLDARGFLLPTGVYFIQFSADMGDGEIVKEIGRISIVH